MGNAITQIIEGADAATALADAESQLRFEMGL